MTSRAARSKSFPPLCLGLLTGKKKNTSRFFVLEAWYIEAGKQGAVYADIAPAPLFWEAGHSSVGSEFCWCPLPSKP